LKDGAPAEDKAYSADRMIITNGSQQMLYMVTEALCDEGTSCWWRTDIFRLSEHTCKAAACGGPRCPNGGGWQSNWKHLAAVLETVEKERGNPAREIFCIL